MNISGEMTMANARRHLCGLALLVLVLTGCASGPKFAGLEPVPAGKSDIYLFRKSMLFASGTTYDIFLDGTSVGTLLNGGYLRYTVNPGRHVIRAETNLILTTGVRQTYVDTGEGQRAFVALTIFRNTSAVHDTWGFALGEAAPEYAMRELPDLHLSE